MIKGKVEKCDLSKSGKSYRVGISGQWYGADKKSGIEQMVGKMVQAEVEQTDFGPWLQNPEVVTGSSPETAGVAQNIGGNDRWWAAFVSNQVAHAIQVGEIKSPQDMTVWAKHAYRAITKCNEPFMDE